MIQFLNGNALESDCVCIVHQVNPYGKMGAGIALQLARKFPRLLGEYRSYISMCNNNVLGTCFIYLDETGIAVANLFSQNGMSFTIRQTDYDLFREALADFKFKIDMMHFSPIKIAIPDHIGCGIAGGDWFVIQEILIKEFENDSNFDVRVYKL